MKLSARYSIILFFPLFLISSCLEKQSEVDETLKNMPEFNEQPAPSPAPAGMPESPSPAKVQGTPTPVMGSPGSPPPHPTPFESKYSGKPMINITGEIIYKDYKEGTVDIDCFIPKPSTPAKRELVNKMKLERPGPFSMKAPANFGKMDISAFIDIKGNGPDPADPRGEYSGNPIMIEDKDITGIEIELSVEGAR